MDYQILEHNNSSKNATRHDVLLKTLPAQPKKQGILDAIWNGPKETNQATPEESKVYAMRIISSQQNVPVDQLLKTVFEKRDKWKFNPEKNSYTINLPIWEGFAVIKPEVPGTPLADYFKAQPRKKKQPENKPDPHLL